MKQGLEQAVIEFETVKKIIVLLLLIIGLLNVVYIVYIAYPGLGIQVFQIRYFELFFVVSGMFTVIGLAPLLMYGLTISKKEFRFYFARACFRSALNKKDIFKQMYDFDLGLQEYNKYLKRYLKHHIEDIDKIFSRVSLLPEDAKTEVIRSFSNSFEIETDKLKPLKFISSELMKDELMKPEKDAESFLVSESLKSRLRVVGGILVASVPIVVSIIALYFTWKARTKVAGLEILPPSILSLLKRY